MQTRHPRSIDRCPLPAPSLLRRYEGSGNYVDSYTALVERTVSHEAFVAAFYTTWVFKLERFILRWTVAKRSTDSEAHELAAGARDLFAAWRVEARAQNQVLMCDFLGSTRSWLMVASEGGAATRLHFGSAIIARRNIQAGQLAIGWWFGSLLWFHRIYSRVLLSAARARLERRTS